VSRGNRRLSERRVRTARAPSEAQAQQRSWETVRSVYADRAVPVRRRARARLALGPAVVAIAGALLLTPAGAAVHKWINQTLGVRNTRPALFSLPASGQILVSGPGGIWTVAADGAKRRLGSWSEAAWSPHARYVAVTLGDQLAAVTPRGTIQWSIARPNVSSPRWFSPNGYRVAYLSGGSLRVIAGDGTGDRPLVAHVSAVAPAWQPRNQYALAYALPGGRIVVRDTDSGRVIWSHRTAGRLRLLAWSSDGGRLLALTGKAAFVFDGAGQQLARLAAAGGGPLLTGAFSPDGRTLGLLSSSGVTVATLGGSSAVQRSVFTGEGLRGLAWSPDGRWLLVSWPAADQWVFIHAAGRPRIIAVSRIAEQFGSNGQQHAYPTSAEWCCSAGGGTG
jgi:WD40 repeat protein